MLKVEQKIEKSYREEKTENNPVFDSQEKIERIKLRTQELIERIVELNPDLLFFLDRSARPISWILRAAWDKEKLGHKIPKVRFINFGHEKGDVLGWEGTPPSEWNYDNAEQYQKATEEYWNKLNTPERLDQIKKEMHKDLKNQKIAGKIYKGSAIIVDDYKVSGLSLSLAQKFFEHHLPDIYFESHIFLQHEDEKLFSRENWLGTYLPWNEDKSYALLADETEEEKANVLSKAEKDPIKRAKGLALKEEIERIFKK